MWCNLGFDIEKAIKPQGIHFCADARYVAYVNCYWGIEHHGWINAQPKFSLIAKSFLLSERNFFCRYGAVKNRLVIVLYELACEFVVLALKTLPEFIEECNSRGNDGNFSKPKTALVNR
jgi:hypothetical protein